MSEQIRYYLYLPNGSMESGIAVDHWAKDGGVELLRSDGSRIIFHGTWKIETIQADAK